MSAATQQQRAGFAHWMQQVLVECERASATFSSGSVHDLRTSLRRCRSLADGVMAFDPSPAWKRMKQSARRVFRSLGALRDIQVMQQWADRLAPEGDAVASALKDALSRRETELKQTAATSLQEFDRAQWMTWARELPVRADVVALDSPVFAHLALERWYGAYALHRRALRNRSKVSFHDLRIGIKRFRYTIENFLPALHESWGRELKQLQDLLGEVHDLDVLWSAMLAVDVFPDVESRLAWRSRIEFERDQRLQKYRSKMTGANSLWRVWRCGLPSGEQVRKIGLQRLEIWASFLDPDVAHSKHVARLAREIFDGMKAESARVPEAADSRSILYLAAITHDVGHSVRNRGHHKTSARLLRRISPPLGWTAEELQIASLVARYHRGALPRETQKIFSSLSPAEQSLVKFLGGILRLACACDHEHNKCISGVRVESSDPVWRIRALGYGDSTPLAEHMAAARHLLELACSRPVFVVPLGPAVHALCSGN